MRDLWKALTLLAVDQPLREEIGKLALFDSRPDLAKGLEQRPDLQLLKFDHQPNLPTLFAIDLKFRALGLNLAAYELAEINRWMIDGRQAFLDALGQLKAALPAGVTVDIDHKAALEAVGALVSDPGLRDEFEKNNRNLNDDGFTLTPADQEKLRDAFAPNGPLDFAANLILQLGWSGTVCAARLRPYVGMFHFNS